MTSIRLPLDERARFDALAARLEVPRSRLVRAALFAAEAGAEDVLRLWLAKLPPDRRRLPRAAP